MNLIWIIILVGIAVASGVIYLLYYLFSQKETYFKKHMKVGDKCIYYSSEDKDLLCEIVEIKYDNIKLKDVFGEFHVTHINNITSP